MPQKLCFSTLGKYFCQEEKEEKETNKEIFHYHPTAFLINQILNNIDTSKSAVIFSTQKSSHL